MVSILNVGFKRGAKVPRILDPKTDTLRDKTLSELLDKYGDTISRKIVLMIAWFNLLSRFLNGCRVPLETTDKIGTGTSPLANSGDLVA